ncbi:MAG TPA: precorrin-8X methylmutase [Streptosporangiaceae bacterium]|nr:precorrin-8X methylmutase [Streptosporangiaceae bacterium]
MDTGSRGGRYAMLRMAAGVRPSRHAAIAGGLDYPGAMVGWRSGLDENGAVGADGPDAELAALRSRIDLTGLPPLTRAVTEQVIGSTAELSYAKNLVCSEPSLEAAVAALAAGAPVVADGPMVVAGIASELTICKTGESLTERLSRTAGIAKAAAAVRLAFGEAGPGAIWVVGEEPVAIYEILARDVQPTLVIGMPAGFVAAVQAKQALRDTGAPAVTNEGELGGPVAAAAVCGVLLAAAWRAGRQAGAEAGHPASATRRPGAIARTAGRARTP